MEIRESGKITGSSIISYISGSKILSSYNSMNYNNSADFNNTNQEFKTCDVN